MIWATRTSMELWQIIAFAAGGIGIAAGWLPTFLVGRARMGAIESEKHLLRERLEQLQEELFEVRIVKEELEQDLHEGLTRAAVEEVRLESAKEELRREVRNLRAARRE